ncbi:MAG: hypothetical protein MZV63_04300 [Marinilabiliales bacterium]|nr:hypothetical protein [Marinilabiliales bacterium]
MFNIDQQAQITTKQEEDALSERVLTRSLTTTWDITVLNGTWQNLNGWIESGREIQAVSGRIRKSRQGSSWSNARRKYFSPKGSKRASVSTTCQN